MAENNDVIGSLMFEGAKKEYPYLADKDIAFAYTPTEGDQRMLEFYPPDEEQRPAYIPKGVPGIEVFNPQTKPLDILGDYVSHYGVNVDPQLQELYSQFQGQLDPNMMQQRYQYHVQNLGEQRPYEQWLQTSGLPEMFRGYTFNQWENAKDMYTPEQLKTLDAVRSYLRIK
jgi:hypothetical protein